MVWSLFWGRPEKAIEVYDWLELQWLRFKSPLNYGIKRLYTKHVLLFICTLAYLLIFINPEETCQALWKCREYRKESNRNHPHVHSHFVSLIKYGFTECLWQVFIFIKFWFQGKVPTFQICIKGNMDVKMLKGPCSCR